MNTHTIWASGALTAAALLLAGCGSSTSSSASPSRAAAAATSAAATSSGNTSTPAAAAASASSAPIAAAVDPCTLITADEAKAALGSDPGAGKPQAGTPACTYGNPAQGGYLLVADADKDHIPGAQSASQDTIRAKAQEAAAKAGATVQDTQGIGDYGFLVVQPKGGAYIFFVKGSTFVSIVVFSRSTPPTADVMTTLAKAAADRV